MPAHVPQRRQPRTGISGVRRRTGLIRRITGRAVALVVGVSVLLAVSAASAWSAATPLKPGPAADADVEQLPIDGLDGSPGRRTIRLHVTTGLCIASIDLARLVQRPASVQIQLTTTTPKPPQTNPPAVCPAMGVFRCVTVVLAKPLGKRTVVDLSTRKRLKLGDKDRRAFFKCRPPGPVT
jgi:hypothetical protein